MQLGMIGLGRMGANLVERLTRDGHECVVFDVNAAAVAKLASKHVQPSSSIADFVSKLDKPRAVWVMVPAAVTGGTVRGAGHAAGSRRHHHRWRQQLLPGRHAARRGAQEAGHPLRRLRYQRWRLRPRTRILSDDRRRGCRGTPPRPHLSKHRAGGGRSSAHTRTEGTGEPCGERVSPLWPQRRRSLREDGPQRHRIRTHGCLCRGPQHPQERRCRASSTRGGCGDNPASRCRRLQIPAQPWGDRGGVAAWERYRVVVARPHCGRTRQRFGARGFQRSRLRLG